ncbi:DNA repair protein endonuclease SAE2/CtIP C-terminus-domain-containing protein [Cantharellus anzutake]|uniref:DNA repair protein endonuclease SAE2/CtIP C-terminus-domain-containing protein n=1 Tax=Cantharellus anzutake TaxID=1750568 RepID=UPI0019074CB1|nr:DNA repair protein endonuclease SAE2/CtIP C-terminus-domain-containing protein [Cantharellus anzutake]KAF8343960.1 DNA repair protein endonuclease SAE2/CtIP C-terminus-domain-containing protein [Cantharellus anzutake]
MRTSLPGEPCVESLLVYFLNISESGEEDEDIFLKYEIDKSKNDGLDYHFDGVVRKKQERQKLHGTDCLCCRDYYDAVGPLPSRLQPPLWRSPSPSESPSSGRKAQDRTGTYSPTSPNRDRTIKGHQQEVSRHRHNWAPPSTPPDYWTIGFPDTQQTKEINERARQMRAEKRKLIEEDAK